MLYGLTADHQSPASSMFDITVNKLKYLCNLLVSEANVHFLLYKSPLVQSHPFRLLSPAIQQDMGLFAQLQHHFVFLYDNLIYLLRKEKKNNILVRSSCKQARPQKRLVLHR